MSPSHNRPCRLGPPSLGALPGGVWPGQKGCLRCRGLAGSAQARGRGPWRRSGGRRRLRGRQLSRARPPAPHCPAADIISAVEFDHSGDFLATGDQGGRVVLFERIASARTVSLSCWGSACPAAAPPACCPAYRPAICRPPAPGPHRCPCLPALAALCLPCGSGRATRTRGPTPPRCTQTPTNSDTSPSSNPTSPSSTTSNPWRSRRRSTKCAGCAGAAAGAPTCCSPPTTKPLSSGRCVGRRVRGRRLGGVGGWLLE